MKTNFKNIFSIVLLITVFACESMSSKERENIKTFAIIGQVDNELYAVRITNAFILTNIKQQGLFLIPNFSPNNISAQFTQDTLEKIGMKAIPIKYDNDKIKEIKRDKNKLADYLKTENETLPDAIIILSSGPSSYALSSSDMEQGQNDIPYLFRNKNNVVAVSGNLSTFAKGTTCFSNTNIILYLPSDNKYYVQQMSSNNPATSFGDTEFWTIDTPNLNLALNKTQSEELIKVCSVSVTNSVLFPLQFLNLVTSSDLNKLASNTKQDQNQKEQEIINAQIKEAQASYNN